MQPHFNKETFTAADIERYHNGSMTAAEMHALERAALDDPFLADAIDGYVHTKTPAADVASLKKRIEGRRSKIIAMPLKRRRLLVSIAAMLILLAGFGWLAYQFTDSRNTDIAVRTEAAPQPKQQASPAPHADTLNADATAVQPQEQPKTGNTARQPKAAPTREKTETAPPINLERADTRDETSKTNETAGNETAVATDQTFSKPHAAEAPLSGRASGVAVMKDPENTFKAKVVDEGNNAVPFATVTDAKRKAAIGTTDETGTFTVRAADSNLTVSIASAGYRQQRTTLAPSDSATRIVLQRNEGALNEVVVTANGRKAAANNRVRLEAAEPVGGRKRFNTYVEENMDWPEEWDETSADGEVVLAFDVDKRGRAINVTVEKPLCESCDTTAVRLIREGARWRQTTKGIRAKAYIHF